MDVNLYDSTTIDVELVDHADDAQIWVDGTLGRTSNFSAVNLVTVTYKPVVAAASQYTAAQFKKEKRGGSLDDEGIDVWKRDVGIAENTLLIWAKNNPVLAAAQGKPQSAPSIGVERVDSTLPGDLKFDQADVATFTSVLD